MKGIRKNQSRDLCTDCEQISHLKCLKDYNKNGAEKLLCEMCSKVNDEDIYPDPEGNAQQCYSNLNIKLGKRGLKIFHQNINGLLAKVDKLRLFMKDTRKEIQVMGLSESHCNPRILTDQLLIDGYSIERKDRGNGKGGGILCYIRNDLKWQRRYDLEVDNIECIWVEIFFVSSKSILICIAYKPPESSTYLDNNFATKFNEMLEVGVNENKETIIAGDLNCNYLIKNDQREIKDALRLNGFKQVIDRPTRITATSKTLIDIIATTHPNRIERSIVEANSLSDHDVTGVVRKLHCVKFKPRKIYCRDYTKFNISEFKEDLHNASWDPVSMQLDFNSAWINFKSLISSIIDKHAPMKQKTVRGNECKWMNPEIRQKMRERDYYLKRARRSNSENDWSSYRRLRNSVTNMIRISKSKYNKHLLYEQADDPKQFWRHIKACFPVKSKSQDVTKVFKVDEISITDKNEISNGFCSYFCSISEKLRRVSTWRFNENSYRTLKDCVNPNNETFEFRRVEPIEAKLLDMTKYRQT